MTTIIIIDDDRVPRARVQIFDDDLGRLLLATPLTVEAGGTHRNKTADGPGVIAQQTVGGDLVTVVMASGDILYFNGTSVVVLSGNNTTDRKYLMSRALVPGAPVPSYETIPFADINTTTTGTGAVVLADSPTLTGTVVIAGTSLTISTTVDVRAHAMIFKEEAPGTGKFAFDASQVTNGNTRLFKAPDVSGDVMIGVGTHTTVGAAGGASALPATPLGYLEIALPGGVTSAYIPYYIKG